MSPVHRLFALVLALVLGVGSFTSVLAQDDDADATPGARANEAVSLPDDDEGTPAAVMPAAATPGATPTGATPTIEATLGEPVVIVDPETGEELASVTVTDVIEDFEGYAEFYGPEEGSVYVAVEMTVENLVENDRFEFYTYDYSLTTVDGFVYWPAYVEVPEDSEITPLEDGAILGGASASGWIFFPVPADAELEGIYYNALGNFKRLAALGEAAADRPRIGEPVTLVDAEGSETAEITVEDVIVPFEEYGSYPPEEGYEYVAVELTVRNLIPNDRIDFYNYDYSLVTADGLIISPAYIYLDEDSDITILESAEILGGESITGYVIYAVPEDAELAGLYFLQYDRALLLADLTA